MSKDTKDIKDSFHSQVGKGNFKEASGGYNLVAW